MELINRVKKVWNTLPNETRTGAKLIVAETAAMSICGALKKKHPHASTAFQVAGIGCYIAGVYQLIKGMHEVITEPNEDYFESMAHENAADIMNGVRKNRGSINWKESKYHVDSLDDFDDPRPEIDHDQF